MYLANFIIIDNVKEEDVKIILSNLASLYNETGFVEDVEIFKENISGKIIVTFSNLPDFVHFAYFTNYFCYPEDFDNWNTSITGFYKIQPIDSIENYVIGEWIQMYVSKLDKDFDNVIVVNSSNQSFKFDFGGKMKKLQMTEKVYHLPDLQKSNFFNVEIKMPKTLPKINKPWWKFW